MIITKRYARKLIRAGKARVVTAVYDGVDTHIAIQRVDIDRVDHYLVGNGDLRDSAR